MNQNDEGILKKLDEINKNLKEEGFRVLCVSTLLLLILLVLLFSYFNFYEINEKVNAIEQRVDQIQRKR